MAVKAGQILLDANGFILDRVQTGGVSSFNIPVERIYEVGNYQSVGLVYDVPDLTFEVESLDVSTEVEAIVAGLDPTTVATGAPITFDAAIPVDVLSPWKTASGVFDSVRGAVIPYLTLEQVAYRFGVGTTNSTETFTLRGDSIYYIPGSPMRDTFTKGVASTFTLTQTAIAYHEKGTLQHVLCLWWYDQPSSTYQRLFFGQDFTDTATSFTLLNPTACPATAKLFACYGTTASVNYPQTIHATTAVKPAAVRGKDIDVYIATNTATPVFQRFTSVQTLDITRRVALQYDDEFGNPHHTATDYLVPDVNGTFGIKGYNPADLITKIQTIAGVPVGEVSGPLEAPAVAMEMRIHDPITGTLLKTIYVPDVQFTAPPMQGRQQQKLETTFNWQSVSGQLSVCKGARS